MIAKPDKLAVKLLELNKDKLYELKEYKYPRNLKQNAKYWKLLYELATKLDIGIEELHFMMLKDYSRREEILARHDVELKGIQYFEKVTTIKAENGKLFDIYIIYYPSHELNTKEFAFLLKGLVQECELQGIDTLSPQEKAELEAILKDEVKEK